MAAALFGFALLGGMGSSISSYQYQKQINDQTCNLVDQMNDYVSSMNAVIDSDYQLILEYQQDISSQADTIIDLHQQIADANSKFKQQYYIMLTILIIFLVMITFMLVAKKVIFKASPS